MRKQPKKENKAMVDTNLIEKELAAMDAQILKEEEKLQKFKDLKDLYEDEKFQRVIMKGYTEEEADRIKNAIVSPDSMKKDALDSLTSKLVAIKNFKIYLANIEKDYFLGISEGEEIDATLRELKKARDDFKANPDNFLDREED